MEFKFDVDLSSEKIGFVLLGVIIGAVSLTGFNALSSDGDLASQGLVGFLENQSGQELDVVNTESAGQFYKVEVRDENDQLVTYYTDGEMYASDVRNMAEVKEQLGALESFQSCLQQSNTVMFGNASQRATQAQIQALGGTQIVSPIYQDVSNNQTLAQAVQLGIKQVPAFYRNNSAIQGTQTVEQVEEFTGCQLDT